MSSPPTPTTSIKNATLAYHKKRRYSSAFASIVALNPFRKKSPPRSPASVEPYEVAPGIWNTDATAKVFGYVDTDDEKYKVKSRSQSVKNKRQGQSETPNKDLVLTTARTDHVQKLHIDDVNDDSNQCIHKQDREFRGRSEQGKQQETNQLREESRHRNRRAKMRTVSSDDRLTVRGANPRTGLVSPAIVSDNSDLSPAEDYVNARKPAIARSRSSKWKAEGQGWSLVESPLLSPIPQSTHGQPSRQVSVKDLQDKLLMEMPGVDNPEPETMTEQRMTEYQEELAKIHKKEGSDAMVDPETLPSPRRWTPEGPSTPPNRLQKLLRRKTVGSGARPRDESTGTVVRDEQKRASPVLPVKKEGHERQQSRVRIVTPSNTPRGSSLETNPEKKMNTSTEDLFLGSRQLGSGQTANATQSQYLRIVQREETQRPSFRNMKQQAHSRPCRQAMPRMEVHHTLDLENQSPPNGSLEDQPATLTLSQYLPRLNFLHPSHFANLEKPTCRWPAQRLPARLRPLGQQRKAVEDACTSISTFTTTSSGNLARGKRPRVQRQNGNGDVPRAHHRPPEIEEWKENYPQVISPMNKPPLCTRPMAETQDLRHGEPCHTGHVEQPIDRRDEAKASQRKRAPLHSTEHQKMAATLGAERAEGLTVLGDNHIHQLRYTQPRKRPAPTLETGGLRLGTAKPIRDNVQGKSYGDGCTPMYGRLGRHRHDTYSEGKFEEGTEDQVKPRARLIAPTEYAVRTDGSAWFAGRWAEVEEYEDVSGVAGKGIKEVKPRRSISGTAASTKHLLHAFEDAFRFTAKLHYIRYQLYNMARHILQTFQHNSPALRVLRSPNAKPRDFLVAMKDVSLAVVYLLVLLNIFVALRKVFTLAARVAYLAWHTVDMVTTVLRWCVAV